MLEIRLAQPPEFTAVGELTAAVYLTEGLAGPDYAMLLRDVATRAEQATVLVALRDGRLVGAVTVATAGGDFAENNEPGTAVVRMLVTDPAARGTGVGTALTEACLQAARDADCSVVRLSTQVFLVAAQRIYERLGFTRTPERDWDPVPGVHLITYVLVLVHCGLCGEPGTHPECTRKLLLEPPRYCTRCRRRMVVQVHPTGWSARCVEHGTLTS